MKKILVLTVGIALAALSAYGQSDEVKHVKNTMKEAKDYPSYVQAVNSISSIFDQDMPTREWAEVFYVPGKTGFDIYDRYLLQAELGQTPNPMEMYGTLMDGYGYFLKALPIDSLPDQKGKVKPKFTKDIVNKILGHVNDFDKAAVAFWQNQEFLKAYDAWEAFVDVFENPRYANENLQKFNDTIFSEIRYNQALAAWQGKDYEKAYNAFDRAIALGNDKPQTFEYAYSCAYEGQNKAKRNEYARLGYERANADNQKFLLIMINGMVEDGQYDQATELLDKAVAADPGNAQIYFSRGILEDTRKNMDAAIENYQKTIALDPSLAQPYFNLGRLLAEKYDALDQATDGMSTQEYNKYAFETLIPLLKESASNLEQAFKLDNDNTSALQMLRNIYYRLGDSDNLQRIENTINSL